MFNAHKKTSGRMSTQSSRKPGPRARQSSSVPRHHPVETWDPNLELWPSQIGHRLLKRGLKIRMGLNAGQSYLLHTMFTLWGKTHHKTHIGKFHRREEHLLTLILFWQALKLKLPVKQRERVLHQHNDLWARSALTVSLKSSTHPGKAKNLVWNNSHIVL